MRLPKALRAVLQPHYVHRPSQLLKRIYREWFSESDSPQIVELPWGSRIQIDPCDHIGRSIWLHGIYDTCVCELLWRLSKPGMTAADVGANVGIMTILLAQKVAPTGQVYSFEPHPDLYCALTRNVRGVRRSYGSTIYSFPFALSNSSKVRPLTWDSTFRQNQGTASISTDVSGRDAVSVSCTTLDHLFPTAEIDLLKLDVEGHEPKVVEGAKELLAERRIRHLLYECHQGRDAPLHLTLEQYGYKIFGIDQLIRGPKLAPRRKLSKPTQTRSSSFLASKRPTEVERAFSQSGWKCLSGTSQTNQVNKEDGT